MAIIPIPKSIKRSVGMLFSGSVVDVIWKLGIGLAFLFMIYALSTMGTIGALFGAAIFTSLLSDNVRAFVVDVWTRNFISV